MIVTIVAFIVIIGILVLVHELGHFATARWFGIRVDEFGFGLPPRAIGVVKQNGRWSVVKGKKETTDGNTIYSLNWLPVGGFVKIKGEDGMHAEDEDSFSAKPKRMRVIVLASGVIMNMITAMVLMGVVFSIGFPTVVTDEMISSGKAKEVRLEVVEILPGSPAEKAGIQEGDVIGSFSGGKPLVSVNQLQRSLSGKEGIPVTFEILRDGKQMPVTITPYRIPEREYAGIGVGLAQKGTVKYPFIEALWEGTKYTFFLVGEIVNAFYSFAKTAVTGVGKTAIDVTGPVGIAVLTGKVVDMGFVYLLQFTALLSINLAIINILPFPALDGGRILFLLIEAVRGRPVRKEVEALVHNIGLAALLALIVGITIRDVFRLF